jgi:hypothetical protein
LDLSVFFSNFPVYIYKKKILKKKRKKKE